MRKSCIPKNPLASSWQDFDQLLEAMKSALAEDSRAAFVFNCSSGRGRTTTAMVIAVLTLWHFNVSMGGLQQPLVGFLGKLWRAHGSRVTARGLCRVWAGPGWAVGVDICMVTSCCA